MAAAQAGMIGGGDPGCQGNDGKICTKCTVYQSPAEFYDAKIKTGTGRGASNQKARPFCRRCWMT